MKYAITPRGIGKKPGVRCINSSDWPLLDGETFKVAECKKTDVLAEDSISLREGTEQELNPPDTRTDVQKIEDKLNMSSADIKTALGI